MHINIKLSLYFLFVICLFSAPVVKSGAIHDAVRSGDLQKVGFLIGNNRSLLNEREDDGKTPLHHAIKSGLTEIAEYLIGEGADINLKDKENESPLHLAASLGNVEIVRMLLDSGATALNDTSATKHGGFVGSWTPLHLACLNGHPEIVQLLLERGANIEARDAMQRTPLILTAQSGNLKVAEILVGRGADINAVALRGYTALLWGARNQFEEYVDLLIRAKARISTEALPHAFVMSLEGGMERLYQYVLDLGLNLEEIKQRDPGLIFPAAAGGSAEIVKSLVEYGFNPAQEDPNGLTPIHAAALEGHTGMLEYLVGLGLNINVRNKKGESAFNLATLKGLNQTADYLKTAGADTSAPLFPTLEGPYMGQKPPGDTPEMFLPGIVSGYDRAHSSIVFSPDGTEAYWTEMVPPEGRVAFTQIKDGKWTYPVTAEIERDPSFSPDGKRLYFIKTRPFREGEVPGGDPDVKEEYWYLERTDTGWSAPISVGDAVNAIGVHWPCSVDKEGNLYFSEFSENIYFSRYVNGAYQKPIRLTEFLNNTTLIGRNPFISPDGDYLLFSAEGDGLNISFKRKDGTWTDRINLGSVINASHENGSPRITADGKYMFFLSAGNNRPWGIYWVSAGFIERLKAEHIPDN